MLELFHFAYGDNRCGKISTFKLQYFFHSAARFLPDMPSTGYLVAVSLQAVETLVASWNFQSSVKTAMETGDGLLPNLSSWQLLT
ncbi:hypothetical protein E4U53_002777 [Claviceps sorghi]|nr:hypothetical protein E4U53_002777 [Claviceps sorghi]